MGVTVTLSLVEGSENVEILELLYDFQITVMGNARATNLLVIIVRCRDRYTTLLNWQDIRPTRSKLEFFYYYFFHPPYVENIWNGEKIEG